MDLVPASDNFEYFFQVKCNSCNEVHPKLVSVNRKEKREMLGGKGATANFVWRCGLCLSSASGPWDNFDALASQANGRAPRSSIRVTRHSLTAQRMVNLLHC
ncbi:uncharacterized protein BT62DRAFT_525096 [Guyanagaster necrorhizus]|uniref:Uncharacterized protein n=1 Tax=Guyanagaster necrorhizus TaxID=856835 RepID=A0A9P7W126_9AGAR|nr:uncharacterized protein BT62DRAFT_525096 [Guyanagaster necrorhizus MCA 3950]KAG7450609.1 hypothetical protein BT62DRAFT_525096 [Guyanagaster necrorhizus MCA 3950]